MWDAADKLHHVQAALQLAVGVVQQFAVFGGHQVYEFLPVLFDQCLELEHHPGPALGVDRGPGGLRRLGDRDSLRQDCAVTVLQTGLHLPGARIVDRAGDGARARNALAVDEMADRSHGISLLTVDALTCSEDESAAATVDATPSP